MRVTSTKPEYPIILKWVEQGSSVLDLGCGEGELLSVLVDKKQVNARGIEVDEQAIYRCVGRGLSVFQQDIDIGLSEYSDNDFDYVILNQTLQQVRKLDFVLKEAFRVGKKTIVGLPNFAQWSARFQIFFRGKVPITSALPYMWYDTPNLHFLSILDFIEYCKNKKIRIEKSAFISKTGKVRLLPNLFAEVGLFLLSK